MARQTITPTSVVSTYGPAAPAGVALPAGIAADATNFERMVITGRELLVAYNSSVDTAYTVTITSVVDRFGRTKDITAESIAFGTYHVFGPFPQEGWAQSDGSLYFQASNAAILWFAVKF